MCAIKKRKQKKVRERESTSHYLGSSSVVLSPRAFCHSSFVFASCNCSFAGMSRFV